ncbi:GNAT family N-acetyltransferase [Lapidilactobacillus wuchangensis]|uniref:GNAT family N-acetyltransferase n=1 Tax=Lapidilactobacillus wuchangensis TaxID=2486001 RepID=UPI000F7A1703|nr:GNAT family N-acetyltransferase [Lapidilactobacillus wuchangensis]
MEFDYEPGRFYHLGPDQQLLAEVTFQEASNQTFYALDHTFVDPSLRGQGIARQLVAAVVAKARAEHKQIMPLCTYAKREFEQRADYADVYYHNPKGATE